MYKFLTEEQRQKVAHEYWLRRIGVVLWAAIFLMVIALVGLLPSYILSQSRHKEVAQRLQLAGDASLTAEEQETERWLTDFSLKLKALAPKAEAPAASLLIESAALSRVAGIRLTNFEWQSGALSLTGIARDRQSLIAFEKSLKESGSFGEVSLPVSNLARDKEIGFQVRLTSSQ